MKIDEGKLTKEELNKIKEIYNSSKKQARKKEYTPKWVYDYLDESFKEFSLDNFNEVMDMLESFFNIGTLIKIPIKRLRADIIYHLKEEGFGEYYSDNNYKRFNRLFTKWELNKDKDFKDGINKYSNIKAYLLGEKE